MRRQLLCASLLTGLAALMLGPAEAGRLDGPPMAGASQGGYRYFVPRYRSVPSPPRRTEAPRRVSRQSQAAPVEKVEAPEYYDFTPDKLAPVDFGALKAGSQVAGDQAGDARAQQ